MKKFFKLFLIFIFVFGLFLLPNMNVFADEEVLIIDSITPIYDENSGVIVNGADVVFNDKGQVVKYKTNLKNVADYDIIVDNIKSIGLSESFVKYKLEGLGNQTVIKSNEEKEVMFTIETIAADGWGRNFNEVINTSFTYEKYTGIKNPATSRNNLELLMITLAVIGSGLFIVQKTKKGKVLLVLVLLGSSFTFVDAKEVSEISVDTYVSFVSQNVMQTAGYWETDENGLFIGYDYWNYADKIKTVTIENSINPKSNFAHKFDVSESDNNRVIAYLVTNADNSQLYDLYIQADGIIYPNVDASHYFYNMKNLTSINNLEGMDTSEVTNMDYMFEKVAYDSSEFELSLRDFDTSNVTTMHGMFASFGYNSTSLSIDLGDKFDTSSVTNMNSMFNNIGYGATDFELDLGNKFDTSNVTTMHGMFALAGYSGSNFTLDLGNKFDTSKVENMGFMFNGSGYTSNQFQLDLGDKFNTSKVTDMTAMFALTGFANPNFTIDLGNKFDMSKVTNTYLMFNGMGMNSDKVDFTITLSNPGLTSYQYMFLGTGKVGAKIKVNYTAETSILVDVIIADSINPMVSKGELIS